MTTALLVYAHLDDEVVFGHPWLAQSDLKKRILICSSDRTNSSRPQGRQAEHAFHRVCEIVDAEMGYVLKKFHSEFYRLPSRGPDPPLLKDWWKDAADMLVRFSDGCDFVVSHSPTGEYSHCDHLLVRRMVLETTDLPVQWSDANYTVAPWPRGNGQRLKSPRAVIKKTVITDEATLRNLRQQYVDAGAWTWDFLVPNPVDIYEERL